MGTLNLLAVSLMLVAVAFVVVRPLAVETFRITTASMAPGLQPGDRVVVNKLAYRFGSVRRGDVLAFDDMERAGAVAIKRVVALPGDTVAIRAGTLFVNDHRQRESYVDHSPEPSGFFGPMVVPRGHVFVLGDNRSASVDSRFSGPVPVQRILGRVAEWR